MCGCVSLAGVSLCSSVSERFCQNARILLCFSIGRDSGEHM
jgi:hypothetical protein